MSDLGQETIEAELAKKIRAEITSQLARWVVGVIAALIVAAALGWWFCLYPIIVRIVGGVPAGAVAAFDTAAGTCPDGWVVMPDAVGRVLVGAAVQGVSNTDETGASIAAPGFRSNGGRSAIVVGPENLPPLSTTVAWTYSLNGLANGDARVVRHLRTGGGAGTDQETIAVGGGQLVPIKVSVPFLALTMCKKSS